MPPKSKSTPAAKPATRTSSRTTTPSTLAAAKPKRTSTAEPNAREKKAQQFFDQYKDEQADEIYPVGLVQMCNDLEIDPASDVAILVFAWKCGAKRSGIFEKAEFLEGLRKINVFTLPDLKASLDSLRAEVRDGTTPAYRDFFRFSFQISREENEKTLDLETTCGLLNIVMGDRFPHNQLFQDFLQQSSTKRVNLDQWTNFLELCKLVKPDFSNYDPEGAWPLLLDDFATYVKNLKMAS
eukprot:GILJ01003126.1.p1 GENE.GILJ01003126.1~~GILJ01003126.1.p1  ORF type:complete len:239 (+),score=19.82 GILJ01003126.1:59-775(+)